MVVRISSDAHFEYKQVMSHWCPRSQRYAGGDALITKMDEGWEIAPEVVIEEHEQTGGRHIVVYHFELSQGNQILHMPVVCNPYVERLVSALSLRVVPAPRSNRDRRPNTLAMVRHA